MPNGVTVNIDYEVLKGNSDIIKEISVENVEALESRAMMEIEGMKPYWDGSAADSFQIYATNGIETLFQQTKEFGILSSETIDDVITRMKAQEDASKAQNTTTLTNASSGSTSGN